MSVARRALIRPKLGVWYPGIERLVMMYCGLTVNEYGLITYGMNMDIVLILF